MYRKLFFAGLLWGCYLTSFAQSPNASPLLPKRAPLAPSTAALERYALMPVNEASGTPSISIPLYEVRSGSLSVPISTSYHASGVRVSDAASWVGLGWSLNAGGVLTRVVRGMADDDAGYGYSSNLATIPRQHTIRLFGPGQSTTADYHLLEQITDQQIDFEPDLYTYNFQQQSGTFMQGQTGKYYTLPLQPVDIVRHDSVFVLTDAQGTSYFFQDQEYSSVLPKAMTQHISAWYLNRMISADKADTISFEYESYYTTNESIQQQIKIFTSANTILSGEINGSSNPSLETGSDTYKSTYSRAIVRTKRLRRIISRQEIICFDARIGRLDGVGDKQLRKIQVVTRTTRDTLKTFSFYQSYFDNGITDVKSGKQNNMRLRLDSISTRGGDKLKLPPYKFSYNKTKLPNRVTGARDYWGYPNGATQINSIEGYPALVPLTKVYSRNKKSIITVGGVDRVPNFNFTQAGVITRVTYPTGGFQEFRYEPNTIAEKYRTPSTRTLVATNANDEGKVVTPTGRTVSKTTVVTSPKSTTWLRCQLYASRRSGDGSEPSHHADVSFTITDISDPAKPLLLGKTAGFASPNGTWYSLDSLVVTSGHTLRVSLRAGTLADANLVLSFESDLPHYARRNAIVGGLRLKEQRIQPAAGAPATIKRYYYSHPDSAFSSGQLINEAPPLYQQEKISRVKRGGDPNCVSVGAGLCAQPSLVNLKFVVVSSNSLGELEGADQVVSYGFVTVIDSSTTGLTAGKILSQYAVTHETAPNEKPFVPKVINSWARGNLLAQWQYQRSASGEQHLLSRLVQRYSERDSLQIMGFKAIRDADFDGPTLSTADADAWPFSYRNTWQPVKRYHLVQTRQYQYSATDTVVAHVTTTRHEYANPAHEQLTCSKVSSIRGDTLLTRYRYPLDYTIGQTVTGEAATSIKKLVASHVLAAVVEQQQLRQQGNATHLLAGTLTHYVGVRPRRIWQVKTEAPVPVAAFQTAAIQNGQLAQDARYQEEAVVDRYDAVGNVQQQHLRDRINTTYLWGYRSAYPIAEITNATYDQVAAVLGQATIAKLASPAPGDDAQVRALLQPLRAKLPKAQVTTYTHAPLIGPTSQTGPDGRTVFYEYDALGRLLRVRDEQRRVLSENEYQYARP